MNIELLESFHQNYPEAADGHLERIKKDENPRDIGCATYAVTLQFNRLGSLVAIGCNDGRIEIWDFVTRRIAKVFVAHSHPVCSLSWSRNSRHLLSASTDNTASIWDILTNECLRTFTFPCALLKVQMHPRNQNLILICPLRYPPVLIDIVEKSTFIMKDFNDGDPNQVASFDRRGNQIYIGSSKGQLTIIDTQSHEIIKTIKCNTNSSAVAIKSIEFSRREEYFLLNCSDKVIRVYNTKDLLLPDATEVEPIQKLKDLVTGSNWKKCCFSGDGEFICAGSMKHHSIYLWERSSGTLVKILHGQKGETLLDVIWHPLRPIILSLSNSANKEQVSIWAQPQVQNWSAFAPDFKELDENVEYEEKESEFDISDEDKVVESNQNQNDEEVIVDIETIDPVQNIMSSDEETEPQDILVYLSISPDVENIEDNLPPVVDDKFAVGILASNGPIATKREIPSETPEMKRARMDKAMKPIQSPNIVGDDNKPYHMNVDLPNAPVDDFHPILGNKRQNSKSSIHSTRHHMEEDSNEPLGFHMVHSNIPGNNSNVKKSSNSRLARDSRNKSRK